MRYYYYYYYYYYYDYSSDTVLWGTFPSSLARAARSRSHVSLTCYDVAFRRRDQLRMP